MTTTFQSREAVRDELVTLFTSNGSWQFVLGYFPGLAYFNGKTPVMIIRSGGTSQGMAGLDTNPTSYRFIISSWVRATADNWTSAQAEDKVDDLDRIVRQVIRDNMGALATCNQLRFESGFSEKDDIIPANIPYMVESRVILADLHRGAI